MKTTTYIYELDGNILLMVNGEDPFTSEYYEMMRTLAVSDRARVVRTTYTKRTEVYNLCGCWLDKQIKTNKKT